MPYMTGVEFVEHLKEMEGKKEISLEGCLIVALTSLPKSYMNNYKMLGF